MNSTLFFNTIGTQSQPVFTGAKNDKGDMQLVNKSIKKMELKKDIDRDVIGGYTDIGHRSDNSLYRPISPSIDENLTSYGHGYRNSPSPGHDSNGVQYSPRNSITHLGNQALVFGKYPQISPEVFTSTTYQQHPANNNAHYPYNSNNTNYGNNNNNNLNLNTNYGHYNKLRSNAPNTQYNSNNNNNNNGNNKRRNPNAYYRHSADAMTRRVHGLTYRFKSRSDVMKIDPNPPLLLNGGPYDQLSQAMWDVFSSKAQKIDTYESKIALWKDLFLYIRRCINNYALYIVGSTMTGFGLNTSDVDMCLLIRPCTEDPRLDSLQQLHHIKNYLLKFGLIIDSELILAKVPILKFRELKSGFEIDLNCNNSVGIYNTHLLYSYARLDWRVRPLVVLAKLWAQANCINDAKNLTVSSYSWTLMVIHYLQCGISPPVLPCLHTLFPEHFNSDKSKITDVHEDVKSLEDYQSFNTQSLGELFIGFFGYYSSFDFNQYAISVRAGGRLLIEDCKQVKAPKNDQNQWKYLCIEEPFDFTNTARSVYDIAAFRHIKNVIGKSYEELIRTNMLNSVLPVVLGAETANVEV